MRKFIVVIILPLSAIILAFSSNPSQIFNEGQIVQKLNSKNIGFFEIKYEKLLPQKSKYLLSQIVSNIEYVTLETNDDCLINALATYIFCDSLIFVSNKDHVLKFSSNGKFIKKIGNPGRGPGEINSIWTMSIMPNKKNIVIYDAVGRKLIYYSFDGILIKTVKAPEAHYIKVMNDNNFIVYESAIAKSENYYFYLTDESGDTISAAKNYHPWINTSGVATIMRYASLDPFYYYKSNYYFKTLYNDTVYTVNNNRIIPSYFINLGKYKLPENKRAESLSPDQAHDFRGNSANYYNVAALEVAEKIFLTTRSFGKGSKINFIINKADFSGNPTPDYNNVSKGIPLNDFDGGIFFWPAGTINDKKAFMPIDITTIKNFFNSSDYNEIPVKNRDKQKQIQSLVSKLDITSNPILMIVTFK